MRNDIVVLLHRAFDEFMAMRESNDLEPTETYLPYEFEDLGLTSLSQLSEDMVRGELRELTNHLNRWHDCLHRWHAWNRVIAHYDEDQAWVLRREFSEDLAHFCLLQPSTLRDAVTFVVTNSMHQVRLSSEKGYSDHLFGDPDPNKKSCQLSRRKKEKRLSDLVANFSRADAFMHALREINKPEYQRLTSDYRNRSSHAIGPRLAVGVTQMVEREVVPAQQLQKQADGTCVLATIPGKMAVHYVFGGTEPLDMEKVRLANLEQYRVTVGCYFRYLQLLKEGLIADDA